MSLAPESPPRSWAEIDLAALRHNLKVARGHGDQQIMAVVKASAYGHGLEAVANTLEKEDIAFFGVANVGEARRLSESGIRTPIYLLGGTFPAEREEVVAHQWLPCLNTMEEAQHFDQLARARDSIVEAHITVDTGMGRGGFLPSDTPSALTAIRALSGLRVTGIGSHLPCADEDNGFTTKQFEAFDTLIESLPKREELTHIHLANSAGLLGYQSRTTTLARPGLMLYGVPPITNGHVPLKPVMALKSRIAVIRNLPPGHGISYGRTFVTTRPTKVGTIGIGYGDGYPRVTTGQTPEVFVRGQRVPLLGRITMDQVMADLTDQPECNPGDEVELFGANIPVEEVALRAGTIPWEIFTGITPRVERVYRG